MLGPCFFFRCAEDAHAFFVTVTRSLLATRKLGRDADFCSFGEGLSESISSNSFMTSVLPAPSSANVGENGGGASEAGPCWWNEIGVSLSLDGVDLPCMGGALTWDAGQPGDGGRGTLTCAGGEDGGEHVQGVLPQDGGQLQEDGGGGSTLPWAEIEWGQFESSMQWKESASGELQLAWEPEQLDEGGDGSYDRQPAEQLEGGAKHGGDEDSNLLEEGSSGRDSEGCNSPWQSTGFEEEALPPWCWGD